jgi:dipeptidase E
VRPGYAADDGAALHFEHRRLRCAVSSRPKARAFHVEPVGGEIVETPLNTRYLGDRMPDLLMVS